MRTYVTADLHLGHTNIIKYCSRPFKTLEEMDKKIICRINEKVKKGDILIHDGDFCFKKSSEAPDSRITAAEHYRKQINCENIVFIKGNHDGNNGIKSKIYSMIMEHMGVRFNVVHNPEHYNYNYRLNLVGHIHEKWKTITKGGNVLINVGVDVWDFYPLDLDRVISYYKRLHKEVGILGSEILEPTKGV